LFPSRHAPPSFPLAQAFLFPNHIFFSDHEKDSLDLHSETSLEPTHRHVALAACGREATTRSDMNPLGFVPDLSMRGVDNSIEEEMTFSARLQPFKAAP
jgi:hypothetical protein